LSKAVDSIKEEILRRAITESKDIISNAEKDAKEIIDAAKDRAKRIRQEIIDPEVDSIRRNIIGSAMLEGRRSLIRAKNEALLKIFDNAKDKLSNISNRRDKNFKYDEIIFNLIKEAVLGIDEKKILVSANKKDLSYINSNLSSIKRKLKKEFGYEVDLKVMKEPYDFIGGVIAYNANKTKIFRNTLEGRLENLQGILRGKVGKNLFEKSN
jgi:V/A-type H+-transporting ATPase subunit E